MRSAMRRMAALGILALCGCAWYHPAPLPTLQQAAAAPRLDEAAIRAALASLANPLLDGVRIELSDGADPVEFGALAVVLNPDLEAFRQQRAEAYSGILTARLLPNPDLDVAANQPHGTGSSGLTTAYDIAVSLGTRQLLTRGSRIEAARSRAREVDLAIVWREWEVAQRARLAAVQLAWLRHRHDIASQELELALTTTRSLEGAVASGDVTLTEMGVQRAALETVRAAVTELELGQAKTRAEITDLLGGAKWTHLALPPPVEPRAFPPRSSADELLPGCVAHRIDLAALREGYAAQEAELRQAILEQIPDVRVGLASSRDEASLKFFGGAVSLGIPVFDRSQGSIAQQRATRERLAAEYRARALSVRSTLDGILDLLATTEARLPELHDSIEPLTRIEAAEREAAARGDVDLLSYQTVRLAILDQRLLVASLSQARAEAEVALDTACGAGLATRHEEGEEP